MLRNGRALLTVTLLPLLWFDASATTRRQNTPNPPSTASVAITQASSMVERAQKGDPQAQYHLGSSYMTGTGVPLDYNEAVIWLESRRIRISLMPNSR